MLGSLAICNGAGARKKSQSCQRGGRWFQLSAPHKYVEQTERERFCAYQAALGGGGCAVFDLPGDVESVGVDSEFASGFENYGLGLDAADPISIILHHHFSISTVAGGHSANCAEFVHGDLRRGDHLDVGAFGCVTAA